MMRAFLNGVWATVIVAVALAIVLYLNHLIQGGKKK